MPANPMSVADELRNLVQRYARGADERDLDLLASLFTDDVVIEGTRGVQTKAEWLEAMSATPPAATSMHHMGDPLLEIDGDSAHADTYAVVYNGDMTLGMRYVDELVRQDGAWRSKASTARMVWMR